MEAEERRTTRTKGRDVKPLQFSVGTRSLDDDDGNLSTSRSTDSI